MKPLKKSVMLVSLLSMGLLLAGCGSHQQQAPKKDNSTPNLIANPGTSDSSTSDTSSESSSDSSSSNAEDSQSASQKKDTHSNSTQASKVVAPGVPWEMDGKAYLREPLHHGNQIYYSLSSSKDNLAYYMWQEAVHQWNKLGVIKLVRVPVGTKETHIELGGNYNKAAGNVAEQKLKGKNMELANTKMHYDTQTKSPYTEFTSVKITLQPVLATESNVYKLITAIHELGHALGFDHDNKWVHGNPYVMNWKIHDYAEPLGQPEKTALQRIYGQN